MLENPESRSKESAQDIFENYGSPISIWPRRAAWTTMVAAGQLGLISDKGLVARLGNFYEYSQRRLVYNGEIYDEDIATIELNVIPEIWDFQRQGFLTSDYEEVAVFHGKIRSVNEWARWYLNALADYDEELRQLIVDVEKYLQDHGAVGVDRQ